jgi:hypothetical protein
MAVPPMTRWSCSWRVGRREYTRAARSFFSPMVFPYREVLRSGIVGEWRMTARPARRRAARGRGPGAGRPRSTTPRRTTTAQRGRRSWRCSAVHASARPSEHSAST